MAHSMSWNDNNEDLEYCKITIIWIMISKPPTDRPLNIWDAIDLAFEGEQLYCKVSLKMWISIEFLYVNIIADQKYKYIAGIPQEWRWVIQADIITGRIYVFSYLNSSSSCCFLSFQQTFSSERLQELGSFSSLFFDRLLSIHKTIYTVLPMLLQTSPGSVHNWGFCILPPSLCTLLVSSFHWRIARIRYGHKYCN